MEFTHRDHLKPSQFMSPFMTPAQLHFSLPLTEINGRQLALGCLFGIPFVSRFWHIAA